MDNSDISRIFYEDGYRIADEFIVAGSVSREKFFKAIRKLYESMDSLILSLQQRSDMEGKPVECVLGCSWCCYQAVFAVSHELIYMWQYFTENLKEVDIKKIFEASELKSKRTQGRNVKDYLGLKIPCPFLKNNECSIYEARPMACRIYLSTSKSSCKSEFDDLRNEKSFPSLLEFPLTTGRMMNEGFVAKLREVGLQCVELPLEKGLQDIMNLNFDPVEIWLAREPVLNEINYSNEDQFRLN